ncbi:MAG TPA: PAS domain S-box protein [Burkholderiales bacterium]|jgi:diguanylate cyclase (GGDEF)-like protein/PAS domain S-box-containing protein|nr:PAS domain S-box protein [Burkholderiales bacterium]
MSRPFSNRPLLMLLLPLFAVLLVVTLWALVLYRIADEHENAKHQALAESQAFVQIYEEHTARLLHQVEQFAQFLKMEFETTGRVDLAEISRRKGMLPPEVSKLVVIADSQGKVLARTLASDIPNVRSREYFQAHVEADTGDLFISKPAIGRVTGQWSIPVSLRLNNPDGSFAGIVMVAFNPQTLYTDYDAPFLGKHGSVGLLGNDDVFRIRRIGQDTQYGEAVDFGAFKRGSEAISATSFVRASKVDQVRRIYSYRQLKDFPMIAIAGLAEDDAYATFNNNRTNYLWGASLGSLFIVAFTAFLMLQGRQLEHSRHAASHAQAIYRAAAEGSLDAFYIFEAMRDTAGGITDFRFAEVNRPGAALIGLPVDTIVGQPLCELLPVNRANGFFDKYARVVESGLPLEEEFEVDTPTASARWLRHQVVPVEGGIAVTSRDITARKRAEAEQRNSRKFLQTLIDYLPVMIFAKSARPDDYGRYVVWNEAAEVITGYTAEKVLGKSGVEAFPEEMARIYEEEDREMLADPMVRNTPEYEYHRTDGSSRTLSRVTLPIFDDHDKPEYILGVIEDITTRKRQEFLVRAQRAELQAVNDASPLGLFRADLEGNFTYANRTYEQIAGLEPGGAVGRAWIKAIHPEDRERVLEAGRRLGREGEPFDLTHRLARPDGTEVWVEAKAAPIMLDGHVTGYVGSLNDITEHRATRQSRKMLAAIIEANADFVAISAPDGRITYLNPAARRHAGLKPDEDISRARMEDYYPRAAVRRMLNEAMPVALRDGLWIGESAVYDRDKHETPVTHMIIAHRDAEGQVEYFSSIMHDISADKEAAQALRDSESRLRTITDTLPAMVSFIDTTERYRFVNKAYERKFGRPRSEILGMTIRELQGETNYAVMESYIRRALRGETLVFERDEPDNGQYHCFETTYIPQMRAGTEDSRASDTVVGFHVTIQDITTRKLEEKRLIQLAQVDSMTGLANRAGFQLRLADLMARSQADKSLLALMYLDIDHFKNVNDTYGHLAGDALLKAFAGRLIRSLRDSDVVARLGGDEFTIILPNLRKPEDATAVAGKIVQAMRPTFSLNQQAISITTSIGLAFYQGGEMSAETLVQRADEMLYQSKASGRDTYNVAPLLRVQSA